MSNNLKFIPVFLLAVFVLSLLTHTNSALSQDLGRHIKLGEIIINTGSIPSTNLFSYTNQDYPFVNHHWLSEVIFYLLNKNFGLLSISLLKIIVMFGAACLIFLASYKISSLRIAAVCLFFTVPLLMARTDERPEIFGFLFFSALLCIYFFQRESKSIKKITYGIPLIQLMWINTHITFIFGFLLLGIFVIDQVALSKKRVIKGWIFLSGFSLFISLFNPRGLQGILYPFSLFKNYGYSIQENQNLFFLSELTSNVYIQIFWIQAVVIILLGLISFFYDISKKTLRKSSIYYVLFILFLGAAIVAIRNLPFFVFIAALSLSYFLTRARPILSPYIARYKQMFFYTFPIILSILILCATFYITSNTFYKTFDIPKRFELKVKDDYKDGTNFFLEQSLRGPILNNFDIGGYLDYRLYPKTKVFVDNRPEAYPPKFFEYYKQSLSDFTLLNKLLNEHHVETIIISHTDGTPWAQEFIKNTIKLADFKYIYMDQSIIILTKSQSRSINAIERLEHLINREQDYSSLLALSSLASLLNNHELAQEAVDKAFLSNPSSCTVKLHKGLKDLSSEYEFIRKRGVTLLRSTGICPYSKSIDRELKNILNQFSLI